MNPLRSVGAQLSLALAVVVAGALAVVWIALVPSLERRLVGGRLHELAASARAVQVQTGRATIDQAFVDEAARAADARVVYFVTNTRGVLRPLYGSVHLGDTNDVSRDPVALKASATASVVQGRVSRAGAAYAEAAAGDLTGDVLLFTAPLHDTLEDVDLVRSRLVWAGLAALGLAVLVGYGAASAFARRIRRLERAADRIAAGDFEHPVRDRGGDELAQLAAAFDRMRRQLAQLDDARRAFIANASHELRTPIFSLGGFIELLRDEELDEETRTEFLATAAEQVQRLSKLATDLLDLSRLDAGRMRLVREPVALGPLAADVAEEFSAVAVRRGHPLEAVVDGAGVATADRERTLQVVRALVDNALLHTPRGTPVRVVARGTTLRVEDEGPGIPVEHHEQVFARFTRLDGTRASGTGLGLAIARELAERMGGDLGLEVVHGRTVFTLALPAGVAEPAPARAAP
jgi:two-component system OmpR family sensor kinase